MEVKKDNIGKHDKVWCAACRGEKNHTIVTSCQETASNGEITAWLDYDILMCDGCENVSFRKQVSTTEDGPGEGPQTTLYPPRDENARDAKTFRRLAPPLRRIYRETIDAFNGECFTLCAAGLRALVEGICNNRKIVDGPVPKRDQRGKFLRDAAGNIQTTRRDNLEGKIEGMSEAGVLTKAHAKTLHEFRFLGNSAVHELLVPGTENLAAAIEILEHTIMQVYELPHQAKEIRKKKKSR